MKEVRRLLLIAEKAVRDGLKTAEDSLATAHVMLSGVDLKCPTCGAEVELEAVKKNE